MKPGYSIKDNLEQLLNNPPAISDAGFSRRVQARVASRERLRKQIFATMTAAWLTLFFLLVPVFAVRDAMAQFQLLGTRTGELVLAVLDLEALYSAAQPGTLMGVLILLSAVYALVSSQINSN